MSDQRILSDRVKAAIKTALATVLAYGIALSMDWDHAYWAAFAVAFCSLYLARFLDVRYWPKADIS